MIKEFKNGNINIKFEPDIIASIARGKTSPLENIAWLLDNIDTYLIGEEYCLSNFDMGVTFYNIRLEKCYILPFSYLEKLKTGVTIKLYAHTPDDYDREIISQWGND